MKRNYWPLLFIGIFSFTFAMIVWTIVSTSKASLDEDRSFLKKYQEVDKHYNEIMLSNKEFNKNYDLVLYLNSTKFGLTTEDIKYSQRVLEKKSKHKNVLNIGDNNLTLYVIDKKTQEKKTIKISLKITKSNSNESDLILTNKNFKNTNKEYATVLRINEENNWNMTGSFEIDGNMGYIYIKTNAS